MNDRMTPIPFDQLMHLIFASPTSILGINQIFKSLTTQTLSLFNEKLELPFGPAAGPHTQLSQNIIAAYLAGARFFELKTVQTLDGEDLPVSKPCIHAPDECYNVEWSTELTVQEAFDEYVKAWFALKLLAKELELGDENHFIFNMSVGYDLDGIQSPKINAFIENLKDASETPMWKSCKNWALNHLSLFSKIDATYIHTISPHISHSITLSTLHGCPPDEIERIATYLLTKKNLHTYIKCNPTLLGYEFTRSTLDQLGYEYLSFDTHHFTHDLQYKEAIPMLKRLLTLSQNLNLSFGVKLTNTFPVKIISKELPGEEMYMSGRALFPLTINLAAKLAETFNGILPISFSGGVDAFNIEKIFETGIYPITLATTLLKPGGYNRLSQCAYKLIICDYTPKSVLDVKAIKHLAQLTLTNPHYQKPLKPLPSRKVKAKVPLLDCTLTPCSNGCPINQDIPLYIRLVGEGKYLEALKVITAKNPLPFITGTLCNHNCMNLCRRNFYDKPIGIRDAKLIAAENAFDELIESIEPPNIVCKDKVAIIGGGPAGLSTAYFLAREGMDVTLFEKRKSLGGIVRHIIPSFRIYKTAIHKDIRLVAKYGVKFELEKEITSVDTLKADGYTYIVVATGAWKPSKFSLNSSHTLNVLDFLLQVKSNTKTLELGKNIAIIGGGNTAMDAARAAKRLDGVQNVSLIYRRTKHYMPADEEELELALKDGILFKELLSPIAHQDGLLTCQKMTLGAPDTSGRRSPVATDDYITLPVDTLITAIGENIDETFFIQNHLQCAPNGKVIHNPSTLEATSNIFIAGDVTQGPATVVEAIRDARKVADEILTRSRLSMTSLNSDNSESNYSDIHSKKALLQMPNDPNNEYNRCLECHRTCACCVDVCPNRANTLIDCNGSTQILHIDRMCNECGNCATFCPYSSSPYLSKLTLFHTLGEFETSQNPGFVVLGQDKKHIKLRINNEIIETTLNHLPLDSKLQEFILTIFENYAYLL